MSACYCQKCLAGYRTNVGQADPGPLRVELSADATPAMRALRLLGRHLDAITNPAPKPKALAWKRCGKCNVTQAENGSKLCSLCASVIGANMKLRGTI